MTIKQYILDALQKFWNKLKIDYIIPLQNKINKYNWITINAATVEDNNLTTKAEALTYLDDVIIGESNRFKGIYFVSAFATLLDLPADSYYAIVMANSINGRCLFIWNLSASRMCILTKRNGVWDASVKYIPNESRINNLETWKDVKSSITFTPSTNCSVATLNQAYQVGNFLYIRFGVAPSTDLSGSQNAEITFSGFTPLQALDHRIGIGVNGTGLYASWISDSAGTTIRCRAMSGTTWVKNRTVVFTGFIPLK